jgi:hypothetical protein
MRFEYSNDPDILGSFPAFLSVVANSEDVIEGLVFEFLYVFRSVTGDVDAELFHDGDRFRPHMPRSCTRTLKLEAISRVMSQQSFSHLASGGIDGARESKPVSSPCSTRLPRRKPMPGAVTGRANGKHNRYFNQNADDRCQCRS